MTCSSRCYVMGGPCARLGVIGGAASTCGNDRTEAGPNWHVLARPDNWIANGIGLHQSLCGCGLLGHHHASPELASAMQWESARGLEEHLRVFLVECIEFFVCYEELR